MNIGFGEIVLILILALLLFGGKKLPELARAMGKAVQEFRSGMQDLTKNEPPPAPAADPVARQSSRKRTGNRSQTVTKK